MNRRSRRGLSTLELVLSLPILLCVMALMVNFGTVASWKVRGLSLARHELWSNREGRVSGAYPPKQYWPQYSQNLPTGVSQGSRGWSVTSLDDFRADLPVARGPMVGNPPAPGQTFNVERDLLDPARGMSEGSSNVSRSFPLLQRLGRYDLRSATQLLNGRWAFAALGARANRDFRAPLLYTVPQAPDPVYATDYLDAVARIWYAPFQADLWPMDMDDEFLYWRRRFLLEGRPGWLSWSGAPDFYRAYAWLQSFCDLDDAKTWVTNLTDRIEGNNGQTNVAERMRQDFYDFFDRVKRELEDQLNANPPPPLDVQNQLKQEIQKLKDEIAQLEQTLS